MLSELADRIVLADRQSGVVVCGTISFHMRSLWFESCEKQFLCQSLIGFHSKFGTGSLQTKITSNLVPKQVLEEGSTDSSTSG